MTRVDAQVAFIREVNLSHLNTEQRKPWWERIQSEAPQLAKLLRDPVFIDLKTRFGGQVVIKIDKNGKIIDGNN